MPLRHVITAMVSASLAAGASAQAIVSSPAPDRMAVTVYRDPDREPEQEPRLNWLNGYALISETRQVIVPAGEATIRFEGVAGGIIPQTAIVTGFPEGIIERNRDAYLLSPATLLDRSLGRRVQLRRTSRATGAVREQEAVIVTGAAGAVVLETADGYEALRCTGLPETIVYGEVPAELTPTPTLSVRTRATRPVTATVTLSYMAGGFDWQANYIANLSDDGRRVDLFAWLTLASTDETSFPDADTQAVAGNVNRAAVAPQPREGGPINLQCWPAATTSDIPLEALDREGFLGRVGDGENIVVTGSRVRAPMMASASPITVVSDMVAQQEDLGDLKLYRIPEPVTVAANSQKQVALLNRPGVRVDMVYRQPIILVQAQQEPQPTSFFLVTRNRTAEGLGLPLPAGSVALFAEGPDRPILLGQGRVLDRAVGEDVEIGFQAAQGVRTQVVEVGRSPLWIDYELIATSDQRRPVRFEAEFMIQGWNPNGAFRPRGRIFERDGRPVWAATIPANGRARLRYRMLTPEGARAAANRRRR